jgi:hypothetical protein
MAIRRYRDLLPFKNRIAAAYLTQLGKERHYRFQEGIVVAVYDKGTEIGGKNGKMDVYLPLLAQTALLPVEYLDCNTDAFAEGDYVLVLADQCDYARMKVIGFVTQAVLCAGLITVSETGRVDEYTFDGDDVGRSGVDALPSRISMVYFDAPQLQSKVPLQIGVCLSATGRWTTSWYDRLSEPGLDTGGGTSTTTQQVDLTGWPTFITEPKPLVLGIQTTTTTTNTGVRTVVITGSSSGTATRTLSSSGYTGKLKADLVEVDPSDTFGKPPWLIAVVVDPLNGVIPAVELLSLEGSKVAYRSPVKSSATFSSVTFSTHRTLENHWVAGLYSSHDASIDDSSSGACVFVSNVTLTPQLRLLGSAAKESVLVHETVVTERGVGATSGSITLLQRGRDTLGNQWSGSESWTWGPGGYTHAYSQGYTTGGDSYVVQTDASVNKPGTYYCVDVAPAFRDTRERLIIAKYDGTHDVVSDVTVTGEYGSWGHVVAEPVFGSEGLYGRSWSADDAPLNTFGAAARAFTMSDGERRAVAGEAFKVNFGGLPSATCTNNKKVCACKRVPQDTGEANALCVLDLEHKTIEVVLLSSLSKTHTETGYNQADNYFAVFSTRETYTPTGIAIPMSISTSSNLMLFVAYGGLSTRDSGTMLGYAGLYLFDFTLNAATLVHSLGLKLAQNDLEWMQIDELATGLEEVVPGGSRENEEFPEMGEDMLGLSPWDTATPDVTCWFAGGEIYFAYSKDSASVFKLEDVAAATVAHASIDTFKKLRFNSLRENIDARSPDSPAPVEAPLPFHNFISEGVGRPIRAFLVVQDVTPPISAVSYHYMEVAWTIINSGRGSATITAFTFKWAAERNKVTFDTLFVFSSMSPALPVTIPKHTEMKFKGRIYVHPDIPGDTYTPIMEVTATDNTTKNPIAAGLTLNVGHVHIKINGAPIVADATFNAGEVAPGVVPKVARARTSLPYYTEGPLDGQSTELEVHLQMKMPQDGNSFEDLDTILIDEMRPRIRLQGQTTAEGTGYFLVALVNEEIIDALIDNRLTPGDPFPKIQRLYDIRPKATVGEFRWFLDYLIVWHYESDPDKTSYTSYSAPDIGVMDTISPAEIEAFLSASQEDDQQYVLAVDPDSVRRNHLFKVTFGLTNKGSSPAALPTVRPLLYYGGRDAHEDFFTKTSTGPAQLLGGASGLVTTTMYPLAAAQAGEHTIMRYVTYRDENSGYLFAYWPDWPEGSGTVTVWALAAVRATTAAIVPSSPSTIKPGQRVRLTAHFVNYAAFDIFTKYGPGDIMRDIWKFYSSGAEVTSYFTAATNPHLMLRIWGDQSYVPSLPEASVKLATILPLPSNNYTENSLTGNPGTIIAASNEALVVDNRAVSGGDLILVKTEAQSLHNGVYRVINAGSHYDPWSMVRANTELMDGSRVGVTQGSLAGTTWVLSSEDMTQAISFVCDGGLGADLESDFTVSEFFPASYSGTIECYPNCMYRDADSHYTYVCKHDQQTSFTMYPPDVVVVGFVRGETDTAAPGRPFHLIMTVDNVNADGGPTLPANIASIPITAIAHWIESSSADVNIDITSDISFSSDVSVIPPGLNQVIPIKATIKTTIPAGSVVVGARITLQAALTFKSGTDPAEHRAGIPNTVPLAEVYIDSTTLSVTGLTWSGNRVKYENDAFFINITLTASPLGPVAVDSTAFTMTCDGLDISANFHVIPFSSLPRLAPGTSVTLSAAVQILEIFTEDLLNKGISVSADVRYSTSLSSHVLATRAYGTPAAFQVEDAGELDLTVVKWDGANLKMPGDTFDIVTTIRNTSRISPMVVTRVETVVVMDGVSDTSQLLQYAAPTLPTVPPKTTAKASLLATVAPGFPAGLMGKLLTLYAHVWYTRAGGPEVEAYNQVPVPLTPFIVGHIPPVSITVASVSNTLFYTGSALQFEIDIQNADVNLVQVLRLAIFFNNTSEADVSRYFSIGSILLPAIAPGTTAVLHAQATVHPDFPQELMLVPISLYVQAWFTSSAVPDPVEATRLYSYPGPGFTVAYPPVVNFTSASIGGPAIKPPASVFETVLTIANDGPELVTPAFDVAFYHGTSKVSGLDITTTPGPLTAPHSIGYLHAEVTVRPDFPPALKGAPLVLGPAGAYTSPTIGSPGVPIGSRIAQSPLFTVTLDPMTVAKTVWGGDKNVVPGTTDAVTITVSNNLPATSISVNNILLKMVDTDTKSDVSGLLFTVYFVGPVVVAAGAQHDIPVSLQLHASTALGFWGHGISIDVTAAYLPDGSTVGAIAPNVGSKPSFTIIDMMTADSINWTGPDTPIAAGSSVNVLVTVKNNTFDQVLDVVDQVTLILTEKDTGDILSAMSGLFTLSCPDSVSLNPGETTVATVVMTVSGTLPACRRGKEINVKGTAKYHTHGATGFLVAPDNSSGTIKFTVRP